MAEEDNNGVAGLAAEVFQLEDGPVVLVDDDVAAEIAEVQVDDAFLVAGAPVENAPAQDEQDNEAPAQDVQDDEAPAQDVQDNEAPANDAPSDAAPTEQAPLEPKVMYKLKSRDGKIEEISDLALRHSTTLQTMTELLGCSAQEEPIVVANVDGKILSLVVQWCEKYREKEPVEEVLNSSEREVVRISDWESQFLKIENQDLFELICASNYLDVKGLMNVACKTVANMAIGKSPEELRQIFGILSDEEEEALAKEQQQKEKQKETA
ncbi:unnamed protein product [Caenorhabditis sp. 36 PRJEB53466]|nr:unnamed protein product [Caenorhabditis sp. 36 PRJEB53466]